MRILFLTQYFPPEIGAPQNRLFWLAKKLQSQGAEVTILTAMPNYPTMIKMEKYKRKFYCEENLDSLKVHRAFIFVKKSKALSFRLLTYFSFVFTSIIIGTLKVERQDYIFCESPPLFVGISALILSKFKSAKLIFNVSDLWPESAEKLGLVKNKFLLNISKILEETLYKNSVLITGQTQGIVKNIRSRFPNKNIHWLKNGIDINHNLDNYNIGWRVENGFSIDDFIILYAGIIGYAQGLDVILYAADTLRENPKIKFVLLGDGPEKERLKILAENLKLKNLVFLNPEPRENMKKIIASIDTSVVPLKKLDIFKGAIPSKIFEALATKKPILLGVEGEAKDLFISEGKCGLSFIPENSDDLVIKIIELYKAPSRVKELGLNGFNYINKNFDNHLIANEFWKLLNSNEIKQK